MFYAKMDNKEIKVVFQHKTEEREFLNKHGEIIKQNHPRATECVITDTEGNKLSEGYAICSIEDQFSYVSGRKFSFTRALNGTNFTKEARAKIWKQCPKCFTK